MPLFFILTVLVKVDRFKRGINKEMVKIDVYSTWKMEKKPTGSVVWSKNVFQLVEWARHLLQDNDAFVTERHAARAHTEITSSLKWRAARF